MRIIDLEYIIEIAKQQNFSKASEILHVSQPALSKSVKSLEEELNVKLFKRNSKSVEITEAGRILIEEANEIMRHYSLIGKRINRYRLNHVDTLHIGSSQFYNKYFFPPAIIRFQKTFPQIHIDISEGVSQQNEKKVLEGQLDLAVMPLPVNSKELKCITVTEERFQLAFSSKNNRYMNLVRQAGGQGDLNLKLFSQEPFILKKNGLKMRELAESICAEYGFTPKVMSTAINSDTINSLIQRDYGVSFLPSYINKYEDVMYVDVNNPLCRRKVVAGFLSDNEKALYITCFIECLKSEMVNCEDK